MLYLLLLQQGREELGVVHGLLLLQGHQIPHRVVHLSKPRLVEKVTNHGPLVHSRPLLHKIWSRSGSLWCGSHGKQTWRKLLKVAEASQQGVFLMLFPPKAGKKWVAPQCLLAVFILILVSICCQRKQPINGVKVWLIVGISHPVE